MLESLLLSLHLAASKPEFPTPQKIATVCDLTPSCLAARNQLALEQDLARTANDLKPFGTYGSMYGWGQCTQYVASRISVPEFMGNATFWSYGLNASGWRSGEPRRGAIGVSHFGWAGHVVVVEGVDGDNVLISEMNYMGWDYIDERWTNKSEFEYFFK